ncbi:MAG: SIS domain-containing protein [Chloroflexota bacterium]
MSTRTEIGEGPDVVARLLDAGMGPVEAIAKAVRDRGIDLVVAAARGTSDHAAIYAQYVLGAQRPPVALATPSLASIYGATPRLHNAPVLGISQSGQSPDIVAVLDDARRQGALTVAVTNDPASALAAAAEFTVPINAGRNLVAATKTYLASIAVIAHARARSRRFDVASGARHAAKRDPRRAGHGGARDLARGQPSRRRSLRRARARLPVRHRAGARAQGQGAGPRPRGPVLRRGSSTGPSRQHAGLPSSPSPRRARRCPASRSC